MEGDWLKCRTGPPLFQVIKNSLALTFTLACSSWNSVACISTLHLLELALADLFKYQASQSLNSHLVPDEIKLCYLCSNMLSLWHAVMSFWQRLPRAHQPVCSFCSSMITISTHPLSPQRPQVGLSAWLSVASHLWTRLLWTRLLQFLLQPICSFPFLVWSLKMLPVQVHVYIPVPSLAICQRCDSFDEGD